LYKVICNLKYVSTKLNASNGEGGTEGVLGAGFMTVVSKSQPVEAELPEPVYPEPQKRLKLARIILSVIDS
jgi:hypothetical protein